MVQKSLIYLLFFLTGTGYAQDQLFKKDNTKLEVKILEINPAEIKYKLFSYLDGPTIIISKRDVALIIYQNGVHEVVNMPDPAQEKQAVLYYIDPLSQNIPTSAAHDSILFANLTSTKNLMSLNILDPLNGSFGVSYLREFAHNYLNLYIPLSLGFANPYFTQSTNSLFNGNYNNYYTNNSSSYVVTDFKFIRKKLDVGLGLHFQTSGKHAVTHFVGPYVGMAQFTGSYTETTYLYDQNGYSNYTQINHPFIMNRLYIMLDNGLLFRITKNFNIMMLVGVGYHVDSYLINNPTRASNQSDYQLPVNAFKFGLSFGYRF